MGKYELTEETLEFENRTLHRIKALRDISKSVHKGDIGGFVGREENLSKDGEAWIYGDAKVFDSAIVKDDAQVFGEAVVRGKSEVYGHANVSGKAMIMEYAMVGDYANVYENAIINSFARVVGQSTVKDNATVCGNSIVTDFASICDYAKISGDSVVGKAVTLGGFAHIHDATVFKEYDYIVFKNWWSSGRYFTWTRSNDMWNVGCFHGTAKNLLKKAYADGINKFREYRRIVKYVDKIKKTMHMIGDYPKF